MLGITPEYVKKLLAEHADLFGPPTYRRAGRHPRLLRFLRASEVKKLDKLLSRKKRWKRRTRETRQEISTPDPT